MPLQYSIDRERRIVLTSGSGSVSLPEVITHMDQLRNDPDFDPEMSQYADLSQITHSDVGYDSLTSLLRGNHGDPFSSKARRALFAPSTLIFGLCRMYKMLLPESENFGVFRTEKEAREWLNLPG